MSFIDTKLQCGFLYFFFALLDRRKKKNKHRADHIWGLSLSLTITGCNCEMGLSHSDCPLVVSYVLHTLQVMWLWLWRTTNEYFGLTTSCVKFSERSNVLYIKTLIWSNLVNAPTNSKREEAYSHCPLTSTAQRAKSQLPSLCSHLDALHHISKDMCIIYWKGSMIQSS